MSKFGINYDSTIVSHTQSTINAMYQELMEIDEAIEKISGLNYSYGSTGTVLEKLREEKKSIGDDYNNLIKFRDAFKQFEQDVKDTDEAIKKEFSAKFRDGKWENFKENGGFGIILDGIQITLDAIGMGIPVVGDVLDVVNALISIARGDFSGAAFSIVAAIPFIGAGATVAKYGFKYGDEAAKILKYGSDIYDNGKTAIKKLGRKTDVKFRNLMSNLAKRGKESDLIKYLDKTLTMGSKGDIYVKLKDGTSVVVNIVKEGYTKGVCKILYDGCFSGETLISIENGLKPIKNILVGDKVLSKNQDTGEVSYKSVIAVIKKSIDEICTITLSNGERIVTTTGHLFMLKERWWTSAIRIEIGDFIEVKEGIYKEISNIEVERLNYPQFVYNLTVDENHTFYVGNEGCLTHNNNLGYCSTVDIGKKDLENLRQKWGVPETDTIAVGKTDISGFEDFIFEGGSPEVRNEAKLPSLDDISPDREFKAPYDYKKNPRLAQFTRHAEEGVLNEFNDAIKKANINPKDVVGNLCIHQSNPRGVCNKCSKGLINSFPPDKCGIFYQASTKYPNLNIIVTSEVDESVKINGIISFVLKDGKIIKR